MLANRVRMSQIKKGNPIPSYYVMAQDSDFSGTSNGTFKYIGSHEYVIIPHVIKGVNVTSYYEMFRDNKSVILKGVASDNLNVTNMRGMFSASRATTLDLSSFDTSSVTNMSGMFSASSATTGYARTQADADKFNASSHKPAGLTFVVK
jgi:surface protein